MQKFLIFLLIMFVCLLIIPALIVSPFGVKARGDVFSTSPEATAGKTPLSPSNSKTPVSTGTPKVSAGPTASPSPKTGDVKVTMYDAKTKQVKTLDIEEYVKGVVLGEMPLSFDLEALKCQAIVARTYVYKRYLNKTPNPDHPDALICSDSSHCQCWSNPDNALPALGGTDNAGAAEKINKLNEAVKSTEGIIIIYNGQPIDALYHSNSGGMTEDAEAYWGGSVVPYLRSVKSDGETSADSFKTVYEINDEDFIEALKNEYPDIKLSSTKAYNNIKNITRSKSSRITKVTIGDQELTGRELRGIFDLRSSNIWFTNNITGKITITTYGNGHGSGLSQYGANARAQEGMSFEQILKFYYTGISLKNIY